MQNCEKFEKLISCMLDGELSAGDQAEVRAHIEVCPDCRALYETFSGISSAVSSLSSEPPQELFTAVMDAVTSGSAPEKKRWTVWTRWAGVAACAALVILVGARLGFIAPMHEANDSNTSASLFSAAADSAATTAGGAAPESAEFKVVTTESAEDNTAPAAENGTSGYADSFSYSVSDAAAEECETERVNETFAAPSSSEPDSSDRDASAYPKSDDTASYAVSHAKKIPIIKAILSPADGSEDIELTENEDFERFNSIFTGTDTSDIPEQKPDFTFSSEREDGSGYTVLLWLTDDGNIIWQESDSETAFISPVSAAEFLKLIEH